MDGRPPPPPQFGAQGYSTGPMMSGPVVNSAATTAMWFGIATLLCGGVFSPFALGFGIKGYSQSKQLGGEGAGKSLFGAIVGGLVLAVLVVVLLGALAAAGSSSTSTGY